MDRSRVKLMSAESFWKSYKLRRLGRPEEYGDLVAFLCSERAAYLTGAVIPLDGGLLRSV